jgi:hypothetical protein
MEAQKATRTIEAIASGEAAAPSQVHRKLTPPSNDEDLAAMRDVFDRIFLFFSGASSGILSLYAAYAFISYEDGQRLAKNCLRFDQAITVLVIFNLILASERFFYFRRELSRAFERENGPGAISYRSKSRTSGAYFVAFLIVYLIMLISHSFAAIISANLESPTFDQDFRVYRLVYVILQTASAIFAFLAWVVLSCFKGMNRTPLCI